jgi:hypothetical protein
MTDLDAILERQIWSDTIIDRVPWEPTGPKTDCAMVCCDGVPEEGYRYCPTCHEIWPDLDG